MFHPHPPDQDDPGKKFHRMDAHTTTSLDGLETSDHPLLPPTPTQRRFFSRDVDQWKHVVRCFAESTDPAIQKRSGKINDCCRYPTIIADEQGRAHPSIARCKDRICPLCAHARGYRAAQKASVMIQAMNAPRFLTLTRKHSDEPLVDQVDQLMRWFRELRKSQLWKSHVTGGVYTLELTLNQTTDQWHPHLHIVFDGKFLPHSSCKLEWERVTGQSSIVHLKKVNDCKAAAHYIAEYLGKAPGMKNWRQSHVEEYATALKSRRMVNTFGNQHGKSLEPKTENFKVDHSIKFPSPREILESLNQNDPDAKRAIELATDIGGMWSRIFGTNHQARKKLTNAQTHTRQIELTNVLVNLYCKLFPHSTQAESRKPRPTNPTRPPPPEKLFEDIQFPY